MLDIAGQADAIVAGWPTGNAAATRLAGELCCSEKR